MTSRTSAAIAMALALAAAPALAQTATVIVRETDVIYAAGTQSSLAAQVGGTIPQAVITIPPGTAALSAVSVIGSLPCASAEGCISADGFTYHDPDGLPNNYESNTGTSLISGISAPGQGYLVGVFLAPNGPTGPAPSAQSFPPMNTGGPIAHPALDQVFFIGDGRTGDGAGAHQIVTVPRGATQLVLAISDACNGYGAPGCYNDNKGTLTVTYKLWPQN